jgi:hypothetical protein
VVVLASVFPNDGTLDAGLPNRLEPVAEGGAVPACGGANGAPAAAGLPKLNGAGATDVD